MVAHKRVSVGDILDMPLSYTMTDEALARDMLERGIERIREDARKQREAIVAEAWDRQCDLRGDYRVLSAREFVAKHGAL